MASLEDDIEQGNFLAVVTKYKDSIIDCAKNIKSNDETFKISTLPEVSGELNNLLNQFNTAIKDIKSTEKTFTQLLAGIRCDQRAGNNDETANLAAFEELFKQTHKSQLQSTPEQTDAFRLLDTILGTPTNRDEDIVEEAPQQRQWPKDPITKTNIKKAVRSKQCKHTYDRQSIEEYISQRERSRSHIVACPVAGCVNKALSRQDLEPDDEANNLIESFQTKESSSTMRA